MALFQEFGAHRLKHRSDAFTGCKRTVISPILLVAAAMSHSSKDGLSAYGLILISFFGGSIIFLAKHLLYIVDLL